MNKHVTDWLGPYLDGELSHLRLWRVESHLSQCAVCRAELEELRRLSALLQESPRLEEIRPAARFVAGVRLGLQDRPAQSAPQRALEMGWRLVPVGLLGALAFVQTVFIMAGMVQTASGLGLGGDVAAQLFPGWQGSHWLIDLLQLSEVGVDEVGRLLWELIRNGGPLGWGPTLYVAAMAVIGLAYWSWLASWWARRRCRQPVVVNNGM